ncbi:hypothetical protein OFD18_37930, partial [Escherichia coli]|nr:hypothetical protein [Escherichia coli]
CLKILAITAANRFIKSLDWDKRPRPTPVARTIYDGRRFNRFLMPNVLLSLWGITIKKTFVQMAFQTVAIPEYVVGTLAA